MKILAVILSLGVLLLAEPAVANSYDMTLPAKVKYCAVVAEVCVDRTEVLPAADQIVCYCTMLKRFKAPFATSEVALTLHRSGRRITYKDKTFVIFAFELNGTFRPYGGEEGFTEKGRPYHELVKSKTNAGEFEYKDRPYDDLIRELSTLTAHTR